MDDSPPSFHLLDLLGARKGEERNSIRKICSSERPDAGRGAWKRERNREGKGKVFFYIGGNYSSYTPASLRDRRKEKKGKRKEFLSQTPASDLPPFVATRGGEEEGGKREKVYVIMGRNGRLSTRGRKRGGEEEKAST